MFYTQQRIMAVNDYRVGDAFKNYENGEVRKMVMHTFPESLMGSYFLNTDAKDVNVKTLSRYMKDACIATSPDTLDEYDCLVALRTGDVLTTYNFRGMESKLPRSPKVIAREVDQAQCTNTLFVTGKHHGKDKNSGKVETDAFLRDLEFEMDGRSLKHNIQLTENKTTDDVDKDMCEMVTFRGQFFNGTGGFHSLISNIRGHKKLHTSSVLAGGKSGDVIHYGEYRHLK